MKLDPIEANQNWLPEGERAQVFSGHESFPCRYGWLPKLYEAVSADPTLFSDEENAIVTLGIGKNMVKSIRFWGQAFGIIKSSKNKVEITEFGNQLLNPENGFDPFLEDLASLWMLHWNITAHARIGAWVTIFFDILDNQITFDRLVELVRNRAPNGGIASGTALAHVNMLLNTYDWTKFDIALAGEDPLGCPLQELHLLESFELNGTRIVGIKRGHKKHLAASAFAYALYDYWTGTAENSVTLSLRSLQVNRRSPGVIFRLNEESLYRCVANVAKDCNMTIESDGAGGSYLDAKNKKSIKNLKEYIWQ